MPLTVDQLRQLPCAHCGDKDPNCGGMVLSARCHPNVGTEVTFLKKACQLRIICKGCKKEVITIQLPLQN
jgi:hypothetical protein